MNTKKTVYLKKGGLLKQIKDRFCVDEKKPLPHQIKFKYGIPDKINFKIKTTKDGWMLITSPDLPGLITQAKNPKQLHKMINDAVLTYFDVPEDESVETVKVRN